MTHENTCCESHSSSQSWSLPCRFLQHLFVFLFILLSFLSYFPHSHDVRVIGCQFSVTANHGILDFIRNIVHLIKWQGWVWVNHSLCERIQFLSEMIWGFFRHLSWQMINASEQDTVLVTLWYLLVELCFLDIPKKERFFYRSEPACEFNRALIVSWNVTNSHKFGFILTHCIP